MGTPTVLSSSCFQDTAHWALIPLRSMWQYIVAGAVIGASAVYFLVSQRGESRSTATNRRDERVQVPAVDGVMNYHFVEDRFDMHGKHGTNCPFATETRS